MENAASIYDDENYDEEEDEDEDKDEKQHKEVENSDVHQPFHSPGLNF